MRFASKDEKKTKENEQRKILDNNLHRFKCDDVDSSRKIVSRAKFFFVSLKLNANGNETD